ncbi:MAG: HipA domain-containing protein, partial [Butyrivibrio sp.]|nr:HipA domain-containing protein [Butyrivibrio sp.]
YDAPHDRWYLPRGTAPSTHIIKQRHVRFRGIVCNEQLCMRTAALLHLHVVDSFLLEPLQDDTEHALFAAKRFDRVIPENAQTVSGLPRPLRLHQEDFAQALGIPSEKKYEPDGGTYLRDMFELLRRQSADPVADQKRLWEIVVFQCLIGNADAHLKNYALLYDAHLRSKRLAPAYDIVSTIIYPESTRTSSMRIGEARDLGAVNRVSLLHAAEEARIGRRVTEEVTDRLMAQFGDALHDAAKELAQTGFPDARRMAEQIYTVSGRR